MRRLTFLYHSGFLLESDSAYVVCDFFLDGWQQGQASSRTSAGQGIVPLIGTERAEFYQPDYQETQVSIPDEQAVGVLAQLFTHLDKPCFFLASHFHRDHFNPFILRIYDYVQAQRAQGKDIPAVHLVLSSDIRRTRKKMCLPYMEQGAISFLAKGESVSFPEANLQVEAFGSTDVGGSFLITLDGAQYFHAGDLNEWHWQEESTASEIKAASSLYARELDFIVEKAGSKAPLTAVMFPCDTRMKASYFTGANKFLRRLPASLLVPMHMWEEPHTVAAALKEEPWLSKWQLFTGVQEQPLPLAQQPCAALEGKDGSGTNYTGQVWIAEHAGDYCVL